MPWNRRMKAVRKLDHGERTSGGLVGRGAGKAKELAGSLTDRDDLAREGRLQQSQADAQAEANRRAAEARQRDDEAQLAQQKTETELERQRLQNEVAAQRREDQIEQSRREAELDAGTDAAREQLAAARARAARREGGASAHNH